MVRTKTSAAPCVVPYLECGAHHYELQVLSHAQEITKYDEKEVCVAGKGEEEGERVVRFGVGGVP